MFFFETVRIWTLENSWVWATRSVPRHLAKKRQGIFLVKSATRKRLVWNTSPKTNGWNAQDMWFGSMFLLGYFQVPALCFWGCKSWLVDWIFKKYVSIHTRDYDFFSATLFPGSRTRWETVKGFLICLWVKYTENMIFQEISNTIHWTEPEKPWVSNSSIAPYLGVLFNFWWRFGDVTYSTTTTSYSNQSLQRVLNRRS